MRLVQIAEEIVATLAADPNADAPAFVERGHHAGDYSSGGAELPAGGWFGNGVDLGEHDGERNVRHPRRVTS
jgi:hypothetical protein